MFKKYLKLFDEKLYKAKHYSRFNTFEWIWFLETYRKIFRDVDKDIFQWYFDWYNYFTILISEKNDKFGIYGLLKIRILMNTKEVNSYLCHNVGIKKEYSGKGFFQLLGEKALDKNLDRNEIALGFPNKASKKGHMRLGWQEIGNMQFIAYSSSDEKLNLDKKYIFEKVNEFPQEINQLINKTNKLFSLRLNKNVDFLNWRKSKPLSDYHIYLIRKSTELVGYLVLKEYKEENEERLHLVDFLFDDDDVLVNLIIFTIHQFKNNNYDILNTWVVEDSLYKDYFLKLGFVLQEDKPIYPIMLFQKEIMYSVDTLDKNKIFFTLFDNDVF